MLRKPYKEGNALKNEELDFPSNDSIDQITEIPRLVPLSLHRNQSRIDNLNSECKFRFVWYVRHFLASFETKLNNAYRILKKKPLQFRSSIYRERNRLKRMRNGSTSEHPSLYIPKLLHHNERKLFHSLFSCINLKFNHFLSLLRNIVPQR